jgi:hypothetical protein
LFGKVTNLFPNTQFFIASLFSFTDFLHLFQLLDEINEKSTFGRNGSEVMKAGVQTFSLQERIKRMHQHLDQHGFITLNEYANLNKLSHTAAS